MGRIRNMEKETIATLIKRGNGEKETVVCCIFTHACVFYAISTASYSTFTFLVSHSANAINSHVRFAAIATFSQRMYSLLFYSTTKLM